MSMNGCGESSVEMRWSSFQPRPRKRRASARGGSGEEKPRGRQRIWCRPRVSAELRRLLSRQARAVLLDHAHPMSFSHAKDKAFFFFVPISSGSDNLYRSDYQIRRIYGCRDPES